MIYVVIGGELVELTLEEAWELFTELQDLFPHWQCGFIPDEWIYTNHRSV